MNKEQLKELVKAHFNLVDRTPVTAEKFGELYDENKAFKIVFPGDTLKVGDEVKVVTAEGQESLAPDGYHKLEDGTTIKTEGSSVVEIESPEGKSEEEMAEEGGSLEAVKDEEKAAEKVGFAGPKESISNVEGTTAQNATTDVNGALKPMGKTEAEIQGEVMAKVKLAVDEAIASEIAGIKEEMKSLKAKFEEMAKAPAAGKTMMSAEGKEKFATDSLQSKQMNVMKELLKNKK